MPKSRFQMSSVPKLILRAKVGAEVISCLNSWVNVPNMKPVLFRIYVPKLNCSEHTNSNESWPMIRVGTNFWLKIRNFCLESLFKILKKPFDLPMILIIKHGSPIQAFFTHSGCYIRAYQHTNKEGYSSVCDDHWGCSVVNGRNGVLPENQASSVYCYCGAPSKFLVTS